METETPEEKPLPAVTLVGLNEEQISNIIRSLVSLITIPIESDTLHALLRLCLRLTRDHHFAVQFASLGGPRMLLGLTQSVAFPGFLSLVTLLFRHILDEPTALRHCMEKVDEDEVRYIGPNAPQILKCSSLKMVDLVMDPAIRDFLFDLLNALVVKYSWKQDEAQTSEVQPAQTLAEAIQEAVNEATSSFSENSTGISVQNSTAELPTEEDTANQSESNQETTDKESKDTKPADDKKARPLIPKSAILRLLSEVIKSYSNCTQLITQYNYEAGQSELVAESCSLLAFVLDQLLPQCQTAGDKDCPALARVFLASIASCIHCPEAQTTLVSEVKAALQRALTLPESTEKHSRVQALMAIISTIIEACPTPGTVPNQVFKGQQTPGNTMVKLLIRKGLVTDLARVPHSLDLSSPYMATTVNAALKPLETLSRAVNLPVQSATTSAKNKAGGDAEGGQGEDNVTIEDVTNNPDAQADLENTHHQDIVEPDTDRDPLTSEAELDQIMDRLLQRGQSDPEQQVIGDISMMTDQSQVQDESQDVLIDVEVETDDMDHDSSQMAAQENSDGEDDALHPHPALHPDADHDDSPDSPSEAEDEEDYHELDQDDEADEDDEEDDEDEEGSDMEADDDDYHEMDNSLMPNQDDDFLFHLEDMHSGNNGGHIVLSDNAQIYQLPVSMHDADNANEVSVVKPDIIECLVKKRDAELAEWREKRKKAAAENAAAAKDKAKDSANASGADAEAASAGATSATTTQQAMDMSTAGSAGSTPAFSQPPILNLQEFLSGLPPSADSPSLAYLRGGPSGMSGLGTDDPFASITGLGPAPVTTATTTSAAGDLPEGVDPSFLAALPENIRQEVIAEQLRLQRIQQRAQQQQQQLAETPGAMEVNPEFLAALPPNIQEEQRVEQARLMAQQQGSQSSDAPVDPANFLATLPPTLRQQVLADMDDSMMAVLPPDIAAEAQELRRELEDRHRRLMQERLFAQRTRYAIRARAVPALPRSQWAFGLSGQSRGGAGGGGGLPIARLRGRHLLDHEALTCLLVLLFMDEPKLNTSRLHRVLRNLCYHGPTRTWILRALLSILQRTAECTVESEDQAADTLISLAKIFPNQFLPGPKAKEVSACEIKDDKDLDSSVAATPSTPAGARPKSQGASSNGATSPRISRSDRSASSAATSDFSRQESDFWSLLLRLDGATLGRKGKGMQRVHGMSAGAAPSESDALGGDYNSSALGQLMAMLSHPVVRRSQLLTDRLLRLLGLISMGLQEDANIRAALGGSATGLDDATSLLLQLSWANNATRQTILTLLLEGARTLGLTVRQHIGMLLDELRELNSKQPDYMDESKDNEAAAAQVKGILADRFTGGGSVVVSAPTKFKSGRELQLPSMSQLTNKTSSQHFFLRILKVIIQLREAARTAVKKKQPRGGSPDLASIVDIVGDLDSEAEAFMDLVRPSSSKTKKEEEQVQNLPRLSELLNLDELWGMLGECLKELARTPDHHAVLILQPAVEAFFIVHAASK
nr:hypothetical protein BaRGS_002008 [Batillaria attramentaria]